MSIEVAEGVAELKLNRPKVNAMNAALLGELRDAWATLEADEAVRGVLVTGQGKCFSAGLDLRQLSSLDRPGVRDFLVTLDGAFGGGFRFSKPMAVAVEGHAIAGGMVLALCADYLVLGKSDMKLGLTELAVGVPFPCSALEIVRHGLGPRAYRHFVFGAGTCGGQQAFELGVGDCLADEPVTAARQWLTTVASRPGETFQMVKRRTREPAMRAIASERAADREALIDAIIAANQTIRGALPK